MPLHSPEDVYVRLLGLPYEQWRLTSARRITRDVYQLTGEIPRGENWEFSPGQLVMCDEVELTLGGYGLLASRLTSSDSDAATPSQD